MQLVTRRILRTVEIVFAISVFAVIYLMTTEWPVAYPSRPSVGAVPVDPDLLVPGALGLIALIDALTDGRTVWAIIVGALGGLTAILATVSVHALYTETVTGVFGGGLLTLTVGGVLAILILLTHCGKFVLDRFESHLRRSL